MTTNVGYWDLNTSTGIAGEGWVKWAADVRAADRARALPAFIAELRAVAVCPCTDTNCTRREAIEMAAKVLEGRR